MLQICVHFALTFFFLTTSFVYWKIKIQFTEENDYYLLDLLLSIGIYRYWMAKWSWALYGCNNLTIFQLLERYRNQQIFFMLPKFCTILIFWYSTCTCIFKVIKRVQLCIFIKTFLWWLSKTNCSWKIPWLFIQQISITKRWTFYNAMTGKKKKDCNPLILFKESMLA